jgi:energy-coupling factor transporter ATP-binding protein EcfA2
MRVSSNQVARCSGYACSSLALCPRMSTRQTLLFESLLRSAGQARLRTGPTSASHPTNMTSGSSMIQHSNAPPDTKRRVDSLLDQLALSDVRHTSVGQLSTAERTRLLIALQLLVEPAILLLDKPLLGCDLFDSFFLLEFLRRWAASGARAVVLNVRPPTHETFSMLSHVLLLSSGRSAFYGRTEDAGSYFAQLHSPCPPLRNPSDYWVDLLTPDAPGLSCQRVQRLVAEHSNRLQGSAGRFLQPPRPFVPPTSVQVHSLPLQLLALCM